MNQQNAPDDQPPRKEDYQILKRKLNRLKKNEKFNKILKKNEEETNKNVEQEEANCSTQKNDSQERSIEQKVTQQKSLENETTDNEQEDDEDEEDQNSFNEEYEEGQQRISEKNEEEKSLQGSGSLQNEREENQPPNYLTKSHTQLNDDNPIQISRENEDVFNSNNIKENLTSDNEKANSITQQQEHHIVRSEEELEQKILDFIKKSSEKNAVFQEILEELQRFSPQMKRDQLYQLIENMYKARKLVVKTKVENLMFFLGDSNVDQGEFSEKMQVHIEDSENRPQKKRGRKKGSKNKKKSQKLDELEDQTVKKQKVDAVEKAEEDSKTLNHSQ